MAGTTRRGDEAARGATSNGRMRGSAAPRLPRLAAVLAAVVWVAVPADAFTEPGPAPASLPAELRAALALEGDAERGRVAYEPCAVCHAADASGRADGTFPRLAGQHPTVVMKQLVDIRSGKRENPIMHPFASRLMDPQEIADVAAYIATLPVATWGGTGPGVSLERGENVYQKNCSTCHGAAGEGDAASFVPVLAGQHYLYLLRQIREISAGRRGNAHPEMAALISHYPDSELQALVDYASRLPLVGDARP